MKRQTELWVLGRLIATFACYVIEQIGFGPMEPNPVIAGRKTKQFSPQRMVGSENLANDRFVYSGFLKVIINAITKDLFEQTRQPGCNQLV